MFAATTAQRRGREFFEARNLGNVKNYLDLWSQYGVLVFPGQGEFSGAIRGRDAIRAWTVRFDHTFPQRHFEVRQIAVAEPITWNADNELAVHWRAELRDPRGELFQSDGVTWLTWNEGKASRVEEFYFNQSHAIFHDAVIRDGDA